MAPRYSVRWHTSGQVEDLVALIGARGLLHNLVVTEQVVGRGESRKLKCVAETSGPTRPERSGVGSCRGPLECGLDGAHQ